jgi:hypothetical protein
VIYLDTSVALAHLLAEDRRPPEAIWSQVLVSSRLLEYEIWTRIHTRRLAATHTDAVQSLIGRVAFLELIGDVLGRVRSSFPTPARTLDALHLASLWFLREQGQNVVLATYDGRMRAAATKLGFQLYPLE